jgi:serine/threonine protein kinase
MPSLCNQKLKYADSNLAQQPQKTILTPSGVDPLVGETIGKYKVDGVIGRGAMGVVYQARHGVLGKHVAIKVLKAEYANDHDMSARLIREGQTVNAIQHPSIVDIFDIGTLSNTGQPYIVMDMLNGESLETYLASPKNVSLRIGGNILDQLLSGLAAAHAAGVIHRDLKPGNIFLEQHPQNGVQVKIIDFGLARQADRAGGSIKPTNPGTLIGTPAFMAPEQIMGVKISPATDLYAVGGIAYQMFTKHLPHEGPTAIDVLQQKMKFDPLPPSQWESSIPKELDRWILNLLKREESERPRNAEDMRLTLQRIIQGPTKEHQAVIRVDSSTEQTMPATVRRKGVVPGRGWSDVQTDKTSQIAQQLPAHDGIDTKGKHDLSFPARPEDSTVLEEKSPFGIARVSESDVKRTEDFVPLLVKPVIGKKIHEPTARIDRANIERAKTHVRQEAADAQMMKAIRPSPLLYVAGAVGVLVILASIGWLITH